MAALEQGTYTVYEVVFVMAPTKTEEEQGKGAQIVSGPTPILVVATGKDAAVASAAAKASALNEGIDFSSSLIHAVTRVFA